MSITRSHLSLRGFKCTAAVAKKSIPRRLFHSYDHPSSHSLFNPTEEAILSAAYKHVPEYGFSQRALGLGAREAGYLDISPSVLPDGAFSLIRYHLVTQRLRLASIAQEHIKDKSLSGNVEAKVTALTWERLLGNRDVIHQWQEALAIMAHPSYIPASLKELALLADEIWFAAGDTSVDPSWYTKRATLSMIFSSTELFMTNDKSTGFIETYKFLARRLDEVNTVGGVLGSVGQWTGFTLTAGVNLLRSKGMRI